MALVVHLAYMDNNLQDRRKQAEDKFNALNQQKAQKEDEANQLLTEMVKLQGEMRVLDELIGQSSAVNVSTEANTLNIVEGEDNA